MPNANNRDRGIVIVSEFFYPNKTGSSKVLTELAEDLTEYGMNVEVITSKHIYNEQEQKLSASEKHKNISIKRVWSLNLDRKSGIKRLLNNVTYSISVFFYLLFSSKDTKVLYVSNPPLVPLVGYVLNIFKRQKYMYLIHDLYPDIAVAMGVVGKDSLIVKAFDAINKMVFSRVSKVIVLGNDMKRKVLDKGVPEDRIDIVTNWADRTKINAMSKINDFSKAEGLTDKLVVLYTGNMGKFHQLEIIIESARMLKEYKDICFIFVGEGHKKEILKKMVNEYNLENVKFYPYQSDEIYPQVLATGDILVTSLESGVEGMAVPSKTYSYLAAGKPLLGLMSNESEIGSLIIREKLGHNQQDNKDEVKLFEFIMNVYKDRGILISYSENVKKVFERDYERKKVTKEFFDVLNS